DRPVLLASLSKAITGACIATLVNSGKLTFDTPLSRALASYFQRNGRPADPRLERATIAHLLTHRSGLPGRDDGNDAATGTILKAYLVDHSPREPLPASYLSAVLATRLARDPGKDFSYSNAGYMVLGAVIEQATRQPYEEYCRA